MKYNQIAMLIQRGLLLLILCMVTCGAAERRLRGVQPAISSLYSSRADGMWKCLNDEKVIKFSYVNDDFCDCFDGSDEPGTSACPMGQFYCVNEGHEGRYVPSSRVDDGICDCCDGSDESNDKCPNTCVWLALETAKQRERAAQVSRAGAEERKQLIERAKVAREARESRLTELKRRVTEQMEVVAERSLQHKEAEDYAQKAVAEFNEKHADAESTPTPTAAEVPSETVDFARANFSFYDKNGDNFVEQAELQLDHELDMNFDGVVSREELQHVFSGRDMLSMEEFVLDPFSRITAMKARNAELKNVQKKIERRNRPQAKLEGHEAEGNFGEEEDEEHEENNEDSHGPSEYDRDGADANAGEEFDPEADTEDDVDDDVGVGQVEHVTHRSATEEQEPAELKPEYDALTQDALNKAAEVKQALQTAEDTLHEINDEIKQIEAKQQMDYGPESEFELLADKCYTLEDNEYVYTLCPFERASQKPRHGGGDVTLGRWGEWSGVGEHTHKEQKYTNGAQCWNGPNRSTLVKIACGAETRLTAVTEPSRCEYHFEFETPAACNLELTSQKEEDTLRVRHEEL